MKKLAIVALSLMTAFAGIAPAQAFPVVNAPQIEAPQTQAVEQVQYWRHDRRGGDRRWGGFRNHDDRSSYYRDRRYGRYDRDRYYRRHNRSNAGAIIGGLAAGAIIGGALAQPRYATPRRYVGGNSHVQWCASRYRSYRAYDNTFQPNNGPRRQCVSGY
jgi:hypothetical protein